MAGTRLLTQEETEELVSQRPIPAATKPVEPVLPKSVDSGTKTRLLNPQEVETLLTTQELEAEEPSLLQKSAGIASSALPFAAGLAGSIAGLRVPGDIRTKALAAGGVSAAASAAGRFLGDVALDVTGVQDTTFAEKKSRAGQEFRTSLELDLLTFGIGSEAKRVAEFAGPKIRKAAEPIVKTKAAKTVLREIERGVTDAKAKVASIKEFIDMRKSALVDTLVAESKTKAAAVGEAIDAMGALRAETFNKLPTILSKAAGVSRRLLGKEFEKIKKVFGNEKVDLNEFTKNAKTFLDDVDASVLDEAGQRKLSQVTSEVFRAEKAARSADVLEEALTRGAKLEGKTAQFELRDRIIKQEQALLDEAVGGTQAEIMKQSLKQDRLNLKKLVATEAEATATQKAGAKKVTNKALQAQLVALKKAAEDDALSVSEAIVLRKKLADLKGSITGSADKETLGPVLDKLMTSVDDALDVATDGATTQLNRAFANSVTLADETSSAARLTSKEISAARGGRPAATDIKTKRTKAELTALEKEAEAFAEASPELVQKTSEQLLESVQSGSKIFEASKNTVDNLLEQTNVMRATGIPRLAKMADTMDKQMVDLVQESFKKGKLKNVQQEILKSGTKEGAIKDAEQFLADTMGKHLTAIEKDLAKQTIRKDLQTMTVKELAALSDKGASLLPIYIGGNAVSAVAFGAGLPTLGSALTGITHLATFVKWSPAAAEAILEMSGPLLKMIDSVALTQVQRDAMTQFVKEVTFIQQEN